MPRYIAFLRAINVGGHTVKMERLRRLFEDLEFSNVETLIASGNMIFVSKTKNEKSLERKIEKYLEESLGYKVATFIRSPAELAAVVQHTAFADSQMKAEGTSLYIGFLAQPPAAEVSQKVAALSTPADHFHVHDREVYWLRQRTPEASNFSGVPLEKALQMQTTFRNVTTVRKLALKYGE